MKYQVLENGKPAIQKEGGWSNCIFDNLPEAVEYFNNYFLGYAYWNFGYCKLNVPLQYYPDCSAEIREIQSI